MLKGDIKTRKWQDESGNERYSTEIQCTDFTFLTTKKESEGQTSHQLNQQLQKADNQNKWLMSLLEKRMMTFHSDCLTNTILFGS